jgi:apolipoprotein N-acyltransferase
MKQIFNISKNNRLIMLSAFIAGISQPGNSLGLLVFIAYIPLFYVLLTLDKKKKFDFIKAGILFGFVYCIISLYWIAYSTFGGFIGALITISLRYGLFFLVFSYVSNFKQYNWLIIPIFVIQEYTCQFTDLDFIWHISPYSLTDYPFLCQISSFTGIFGLSLIIFTINYLLTSFYLHKRDSFQSFRRFVYVTLVFISFLLLNLFASIEYENIEYQYIKVGIIQPNIDAFEKWKPENKELAIKRLFSASRKASSEGADFILWPETSVPFYLRTAYYFQEEIHKIVNEDSITMVVGSLDFMVNGDEEKEYYNSAFHFLRNKEYKTYNKQKLVAVAEKDIIPKLIQDLIALPGASGFTKGNDNTVFKSQFNIYDQKNNKLGVDTIHFATTICIESNFPTLISDMKNNGMQFLNIITNDGWFYPHYDWAKSFLGLFNINPEIPSKGAFQHNRIAVMRAIENRTTILRSANTGISSIIDPSGYFVRQTRQYVHDEIIDLAPIPKKYFKTFYNKHGDFIVYILILTICIVMMNLLTRKYKENQILIKK